MPHDHFVCTKIMNKVCNYNLLMVPAPFILLYVGPTVDIVEK